MNTQTTVIIGEILATHGINDWVTIKSFSYPPENLISYDTFIYIDNSKVFVKILQLKIMPKKIIIQIEDYNEINKSEILIGKNIFINNSDMPPLEKGEYYWKDLEGLDVFTSENEYLGIVDFIFNNGANDVIAVKKDNVHNYIALIKSNLSIIYNKKIIIKNESI